MSRNDLLFRAHIAQFCLTLCTILYGCSLATHRWGAAVVFVIGAVISSAYLASLYTRMLDHEQPDEEAVR